jgi:hypothetical protein
MVPHRRRSLASGSLRHGKLGSTFGQLFKAEVDRVTDMAMAA